MPFAVKADGSIVFFTDTADSVNVLRALTHAGRRKQREAREASNYNSTFFIKIKDSPIVLS